MTVAEVMDPVGRDAGYYKHSGGGMTLSGGEPLVQWQFGLRLLHEAKRMGLHTSLDTTGYADWQNLAELLNFVQNAFGRASGVDHDSLLRDRIADDGAIAPERRDGKGFANQGRHGLRMLPLHRFSVQAAALRLIRTRRGPSCRAAPRGGTGTARRCRPGCTRCCGAARRLRSWRAHRA